MTIFMKRDYRHRWIILLATLVGMAVTGALGRWQLSRAAQKEALQAALDERSSLPPLSQSALARTPEDAQAQHFRTVRLSGRWLEAGTVFLDNRAMDGRAGFIVVSPLLLASGDAVVVQRGWVPRDQLNRTRLPTLHTPQGDVNVEARVAPPPSKLMDFAAQEAGVIRQNLDLALYARELSERDPTGALSQLQLRPMSLLQLSPVDQQDALLRHWPRPAVKIGTHYGYAAQWFGLCALMAGLYVWFQLIRPRLGARQQRQ